MLKIIALYVKIWGFYTLKGINIPLYIFDLFAGNGGLLAVFVK